MANTVQTLLTGARLLVDLERPPPDVLDGHRQHVGDDLHAPAGPGRALVVHDEVQHLAALVAADDLAVLATHVEDGADAGAAHVVGAPGVAGDLGDGAVGEGHVDPAVAGAHRVGDVVEREADGLAAPLKARSGAVGAGRAGAGGVEGEKLAVGQQDRLGTHRPDVDAHGHGRGRRQSRSGACQVFSLHRQKCWVCSITAGLVYYSHRPASLVWTRRLDGSREGAVSLRPSLPRR